MLKNSNGNVMELTDFNVNPNDVFVGFTVYPDADAKSKGLTPFEKTLNLRVSLGNEFRKKLAAAKGSTALIETTLKGLVETEVAAQAAADAKKFSLNGQLKGDWK